MCHVGLTPAHPLPRELTLPQRKSQPPCSPGEGHWECAHGASPWETAVHLNATASSHAAMTCAVHRTSPLSDPSKVGYCP